jgi:hypothetical protein
MTMDEGKLHGILHALADGITNLAASMPSGGPFIQQAMSRVKTMVADLEAEYAALTAPAEPEPAAEPAAEPAPVEPPPAEVEPPPPPPAEYPAETPPVEQASEPTPDPAVQAP